MTSTTGHELVPWTDSFALLKQCDDEDAGVELWDFSERRTPSNENDIPDGKKKRNADSFLYRRSRFILAKPRPPRGGARNIMSYLADVGGRMARHAVITRGWKTTPRDKWAAQRNSVRGDDKKVAVDATES